MNSPKKVKDAGQAKEEFLEEIHKKISTPRIIMTADREEKKEMVDHPNHYNYGKIEVIEAVTDWKLGFCDGNVIKYVARHQHKGAPIEDLKKARWYLDFLINKLEEEARRKMNGTYDPGNV